MKKIGLLFILMLLTLLADAKVQIDGIFFELDSESKTASVCRFSSGNDYSGDIVIPETIDYENTTYIVTSIGSCAFINCEALNSITIPKTVTYVGNCAFERSKSLKAVYISDLEAWCKIEFGGWQYANPLYLAHHLYLNGEEIQELEIPNSITEIKDFTFQGMSSMTSVKIPNSVKSIGEDAFFRCGLTSVTIPESVTKISSQAFYQCSLLSSVSFSESVSSLGHFVFEETPWLTEQPDGILYVGKILYCYKGEMPNNTSIEIKEGTKGIAGEAFRGCSGLTSVTIPSSVISIGKLAFCGCTGLKTLIIPETVKEFDGAFAGCSGLTSISFPQNITSIGDDTFSGCSGLTSFVIPESVTSIGENAFSGCSGLTSITIPENVTSIGDGAFEYCTGLTSMTIPNSVRYLGYFSFMGCSSLISVNLPNSLTEILGQTFADCPLQTITIPQNVTKIESLAFGCIGLEMINVLAITPPIIFEETFNNYDATLMVPEGTRDVYLAADYWKNFKEIIDGSNTKHKLIYMVDGEEYKTYEVLEGTILTPEEAPTKEGYVFSGWSELPATMPGEDLTITGSFTSLDSYDVITLKDSGKGTWCSDYDLDFTDVEGIKAYTATGYDDIKKTIWLTRVFSVPAGTGIMVKGDPGEHKIPHATVKAVYASFFKGVTGEAISINETDGDNTNYYMAGGQFKKVNGSTTISPNRAYLQLPTLVFAGTRSIDVIYEDEIDDKTGIHSAAITSDQEPDIYYNLQGQRVDNPKKGLYIKNGKKVIIK